MRYQNILQAIGHTPLLKLNKINAGLKPQIYVKADYLNPGGSVKDRIGIAMIDDAERSGLLKPGGTIIEGTSGNTGMGLALVAAVRGYKAIFTITDKQSREKIDLLKAFGAEVIVCPTAVAPEDPRSYYSVARKLAREIPNSFFPNQYDNPANPETHYRSTGPEIWEDSEGRITHFVCGMGTGGTISGVSRFLKEKNPKVRIIGADPIGSLYHEFFHTGKIGAPHTYTVEGIGEDILPANMDFKAADDVQQVTDKECFLWTRKLARLEGIFAGGSTGGAIAVAMRLARDLSEGDFIVVFIPDGGMSYLSKVYNDEWMRENQYLEPVLKLSAEDILNRKKTRRLICMPPGASVAEALSLIRSHEVSQLPVMEEGAPIGAIYENAILDAVMSGRDLKGIFVREIMDAPFPIVERAAQIDRITSLLTSDIPAVFVDLDGQFEIITKYDLAQAIAAES